MREDVKKELKEKIEKLLDFEITQAELKSAGLDYNDSIENISKSLVKATSVVNENKSVSDIITEKNLSFKDNKDGTLLYESPSEFVSKAAGSDKEITRQDYRPSKDELKLINSKKASLETVKEQSGYVVVQQATNAGNRPDRRAEAFNDFALNRMGQYAVKNLIPWLVASKSDCEDHTWKAINTYGFVFDYFVKDGALFYKVYIPENNSTKDILDRLFMGQLNKLSVGFSLSYADVMCSACKTISVVDERCDHSPGDMDERGKMVYAIITDVKDNYEISSVAVPCQAEANVPAKSVKALVTKSLNGFMGQVQAVGSTYDPEAFKNWAATNSGTIMEYLKSIGSKEYLTVADLEQKPAEENSEIDKINNGKNTIEDNSLMTVDVEKPTVDQAPAETEAKAEVKTDAVPPVETVALDQEDKLCKVAEKVKTAAVKEISDVIKSDNAEVLKAIASLSDELKSVKAELEAAKKELKAEIEVASKVPVSNQVDATRSGGEGVNTDVLIQTDESSILGPLV